MKNLLFVLFCALFCTSSYAVGPSGMYQWSVSLSGYVSNETGKAPTAYLWIPDGCKTVKAAVVAQQNMTEEALFRMPSFRNKLKEMDVALIWVAPWFSQKWDPETGCQSVFDDMMTALSYQSGHKELANVPVVPFGHSAQATFPWNFAAWNNDRTLCIISFHGDAPRTNLCGFGTSNVEWGRTRNIDGIPGLMIEGEYEWWEARVNPALAFRMMYPESCVSFLCDTGRGHFDCSERTADYIALFIKKALQTRLQADGSLKKVDVRSGWLVDRFRSDMPETDGVDKGKAVEVRPYVATAAPFAEYKGDKHDAFWYFDKEMAMLTEKRYAETKGKKLQYVGVEQNGKLVKPDNGIAKVEFIPENDGITFHLRAVSTDSTGTSVLISGKKSKLHIEVISGPVKMLNDTTFQVCEYEAGWDNPRRCLSVWMVAVAEPDGEHKGAVLPININLPANVIESVRRK